MVIDIREKIKNKTYVKSMNGERGCCRYCCWVRYIDCVVVIVYYRIMVKKGRG